MDSGVLSGRAGVARRVPGWPGVCRGGLVCVSQACHLQGPGSRAVCSLLQLLVPGMGLRNATSGCWHWLAWSLGTPPLLPGWGDPEFHERHPTLLKVAVCETLGLCG